MRRLLAEAEPADRFRLREGRLHPAFGNGTLMAAALARPRVRLATGGGEGLRPLAEVLGAVLDWQARHGPRERRRPSAAEWGVSKARIRAI